MLYLRYPLPVLMTVQRRANEPVDISGAAMFNRENADQIGKLEAMLCTADIDVDLTVVDV
jgi:hypothetical protein